MIRESTNAILLEFSRSQNITSNLFVIVTLESLITVLVFRMILMSYLFHLRISILNQRYFQSMKSMFIYQ